MYLVPSMLTILGGIFLSLYLFTALKERGWKSKARSYSSKRASIPHCYSQLGLCSYQSLPSSGLI